MLSLSDSGWPVFPRPALAPERQPGLQMRFGVYCRRYEVERKAARQMTMDALQARLDAARDELERRRWTV